MAGRYGRDRATEVMSETAYTGGVDLDSEYGRKKPSQSTSGGPYGDDDSSEAAGPYSGSQYSSPYVKHAAKPTSEDDSESSFRPPAADRPAYGKPSSGYVEEDAVDVGKYGSRPGQGRKPAYGEQDENSAYGRRPDHEDDYDTGAYGRKPGHGDDHETGAYGRKPGHGDEDETGAYGRKPGHGDDYETGAYGRKPGHRDEDETGAYGRKPGHGDDYETGAYGRKPGHGDEDETEAYGRRPGHGEEDESGAYGRKTDHGEGYETGAYGRKPDHGGQHESSDHRRKPGYGRQDETSGFESKPSYEGAFGTQEDSTIGGGYGRRLGAAPSSESDGFASWEESQNDETENSAGGGGRKPHGRSDDEFTDYEAPRPTGYASAGAVRYGHEEGEKKEKRRKPHYLASAEDDSEHDGSYVFGTSDEEAWLASQSEDGVARLPTSYGRPGGYGRPDGDDQLATETAGLSLENERHAGRTVGYRRKEDQSDDSDDEKKREYNHEEKHGHHHRKHDDDAD